LIFFLCPRQARANLAQGGQGPLWLGKVFGTTGSSLLFARVFWT